MIVIDKKPMRCYMITHNFPAIWLVYPVMVALWVINHYILFKENDTVVCQMMGIFPGGGEFPFSKNLLQFPNQWLWQLSVENIKFLTRSILFLFIWSLWHLKWCINLLLILGFANGEFNDFIISKTLIIFIRISTKHITSDWYLFRSNSILISCNLLSGNKVWAWHEKWEKEKKNPKIADAIKKPLLWKIAKVSYRDAPAD